MFCCQFKEWSIEIFYNTKNRLRRENVSKNDSTTQKKRSAGKSVCKNSFTRQKPSATGKTVCKIVLQYKKLATP